MHGNVPSDPRPAGMMARPGFLAFLHSEAGADFLAGFEHIRYAKGALIATPGSGQDRVFIVISGRVRA